MIGGPCFLRIFPGTGLTGPACAYIIMSGFYERVHKKGGELLPKVIENLRETILQQSRRLLLESGYEAFAMRDAAGRCGIAVGTLYRYFPSKEALAGSVMLEDWQDALARIGAECAAARSLGGGLEAVYRGVMRFSEPYRGVWAGCGSAGSRDPDYARRHRLLVRQLAAALAPLLEKEAGRFPPQTGLFLAENILICAGSSEMSFSSFQEIVRQLWKAPAGRADLS